MAVVPWEFTPQNLARSAEAYYRGGPVPAANKFFCLLTNASTFTDTSNLLTVVQQEIIQTDSGYARQPYNPGVGAYDAPQLRYEFPSVDAVFTAPGNGFIQFDRAVLISGASPTANKIFTADPATNRLTAEAHGLVNGDRVVPTADSGATLPAGMTAQAYYAKSIDPNTVELYSEVGLTTILDFTSAGSGTLRLRYAQGNFEAFLDFGSQTIPAGSNQLIQLRLNFGKANALVNDP